jgi:hypothetical protein
VEEKEKFDVDDLDDDKEYEEKEQEPLTPRCQGF